MTDITAAMIERACKAYHLEIYGYPCLITDMQRRGMEAAIREVLRPMEEAQTADTYRIKPLEWKEKSAETGTYYMAIIPLGSFLIEQFGHEWGWCFSKESAAGFLQCDTLEAAKAAAEAHWRALLLDSVLEEV